MFVYYPQGVCSQMIEVDLDGDVIKEVKFTGGCHGNLQAVSKLVVGMTVDEACEKLEGIRCGFKPTSCADQMCKALKAARSAE
ncbi:MAG: TIGR03905 family TSCPD domain-containing protein [Clostridiales bacterium]|nr:TIGR03905 family TSCPD domain-containing protein [Candidatus Crickella equi]